MKYLTALALIFLSTFLTAQTVENMEIFTNAHGLKKDGILYFEVEGYSIFSRDYDNLYYDKRGIKIARRKNKIQANKLETIDSTLKFPHKILTNENTVSEEIVNKRIYYFLPRNDNKLKIIGFSISLTRDLELERQFLKSYIENKVPEYVITKTAIDSINFVGRYLPLGPACHWMGPHNIQCPDFGQMSWSQLRTIERAKELLNAQFVVTANKGIGEVLNTDSVNVIFEGKETVALKAIYKIKIPKIIMGGSNVLIIYYIAAEVRGKFIACIMSHYTDDVNAKYLAPLLNEVMELKKYPVIQERLN